MQDAISETLNVYWDGSVVGRYQRFASGSERYLDSQVVTLLPPVAARGAPESLGTLGIVSGNRFLCAHQKLFCRAHQEDLLRTLETFAAH